MNPPIHPELAVDLSQPRVVRPEEKELTFADVGIFNRKQARAAGARNAKRRGRMAVVRSRNAR